MTKTKKLPVFGCAACPLGSEKEQKFVTPWSQEKPEIIVMGPDPYYDKDLQSFLSSTFSKRKVDPLILNAIQCDNDKAYAPRATTKVINACKQAYVSPILEQYPGVPILGLGPVVAQSILGGKRNEKNTVGHVRYVNGREIYFTAYPDADVRCGRNTGKKENFSVMLDSCIRSVRNPGKVEWKIGCPDGEFWNTEYLYLDLESTSELLPWYSHEGNFGSNIAIAGFSNGKTDMAWIVPFNHKDHDSRYVETFLRYLSSFRGTIVAFNSGFESIYFRYHHGLKFERVEDPLSWERLKPAAEVQNDLKYIAKRDYGLQGYESKVHTLWDQGVNSHNVDLNLLAEYCAFDVLIEESLHKDQMRNPHENEHVYRMHMAYQPYVTEMTYNGLYVDVETLDALDKENEHKITEVRQKIANIAGLEFNPKSPIQVKEYLHSIGIKVEGTGEEVLSEIVGKSPLIPLILEDRAIEKLDSTYFKGYRAWLINSLIHSSFGNPGAETTRLSSHDPNVQNTPNEVRPIVVSRWGELGRLIMPDLDSLEYRLIGHDSKDELLLEIFHDPKKKIHQLAASMCLKLSLEECKRGTPNYKKGKTINFASGYQCGFEKFSYLIGYEDRELFERVQKLYPGVNAYRERIEAELFRTKRAENMFGLVRYFPYVDQNIAREAWNYRFQSAGHMLLIIFLLEVMNEIEKQSDDFREHALLTHELHDSFIIDTTPQFVDKVRDIIIGIGQDLNPLIKRQFGVEMRIPMLSDCVMDYRWGKLK